MTKRFWNLFKVSPVIVASAFFAANSALAAEVNDPVTNVAQSSESQDSNNIGQVTSVSQFSDVQPTDWAFQALQSLVERYGCIAGYPNSTYRGNRALTRYEFAAGLNACLDRVNELIATATADLVSKQDLATLQRLQEEYSAELATLRGRVDGLEARTSELEANQFSTTTKLVGEAIFSVSDAFGGNTAARSGNSNTPLNSNTVFSDRVRLNLYSSFTGTDQLQIRLQAGNTINNSGVTGTNMTRLGYDINPSDNSVSIDKINYAFNLKDAVRVKVDVSNSELYENVDVFNPDFRSSGTGAISRYGRFSPIYRQGQNGAGLTVTFNPKGPISLSGAYLAQSSNQTANGITTINAFGANNPAANNGLFDGDSTIFGQLSLKPNKAFNIGLTYAHTYLAGNSTNSFFQGTGSTFANSPFGAGAGIRAESSNYGVEATFQFSPKLALSGWGGYTTASTLTGLSQNAEIWYYGATLALRDFGKQGNVLGIIFGQAPKVTGGSVTTNSPFDSGTSYHLEGLYKYKVSDNIQVTPGLLVIFNPENNNNNDTEYVGTLRTTFTF
ncbi:MAG: iron uptake porin [Nostoc sp.]|uniref:iron uptake porin n=1 Tax=Nostoc sp. TaxID=1180 RepID=UPI002FF5D87F